MVGENELELHFNKLVDSRNSFVYYYKVLQGQLVEAA